MFVGQANANIESYRLLERQEEIIIIKNIRNILLNTQNKVTLCLKDGIDNAACYCRFKKNYAYLNQLTKRMFEAYPDWAFIKELSYVNDDKLKTIVLNEMMHQIDIKFQCVYTKY